MPLTLVAGLGHWLIGSVDWYIVGVLTRPTSSPTLAAPASGTVIDKAAQLVKW